MAKEQVIDRGDVDDQLLGEAIKLDCGVCKNLYHGTSISVAQKIKDNAEIEIGPQVGYLGKGVYCYHLDVEASRLWARKKYKGSQISVFALEADLGNTFYVSQELIRIFQNRASELKQLKLDMGVKVGYVIEVFVKDVMMPELKIEIHTVGRNYVVGGKTPRRPVLMYALRHKGMIKKADLYWEES
ncbi:MAG: hypothetical protein WC369_00255 [Dehalococcoidales bacterium]